MRPGLRGTGTRGGCKLNADARMGGARSVPNMAMLNWLGGLRKGAQPRIGAHRRKRIKASKRRAAHQTMPDERTKKILLK